MRSATSVRNGRRCTLVRSSCRRLSSRVAKGSRHPTNCVGSDGTSPGRIVKSHFRPKNCGLSAAVRLQARARANAARREASKRRAAVRTLQAVARKWAAAATSARRRSSPSPTDPRRRDVGVRQGELAIWITDKIFDGEALRSLLHDPLSTTTSSTSRHHSRFSLVQLVDAVVRHNSVTRRPLGRATTFVDVECALPREPEDRRWDVRLTSAWVRAATLENVAFRTATRLVGDVVAMDERRCKRAKVDWHVQRVLPGSRDQDVHVDDGAVGASSRCYYTVIVPLVDNPRAGGTYFPRLERTFTEYGAAAVFDGTVEHAGLGNRSQQVRYFLYAAIYTGKDHNC